MSRAVTKSVRKITRGAPKSEPKPESKPNPTLDESFDIESVLQKLGNGLTAARVNGAPVFTDSAVTLVCDDGHVGNYLFKNISGNTKCASCTGTKQEMALKLTAEKYFCRPFSRTESAVGCFGNAELGVKIASGSAATACVDAGMVTITLPAPYTLKNLAPALRRLCEQNRQLFTPTAADIITKATRTRVIKEPVPITRDMVSRGSAWAQFDPDIIPDDESHLLQLENCYYK